jgi:hypothetical protein
MGHTSHDTPDRDGIVAVPELPDPGAATAPPPATAPHLRPRRSLVAAVLSVLVLPPVLAVALTLFGVAGPRSDDAIRSARLVSASDMESEFGIKIRLIAVTADGGLVDVRFSVVDAAKAESILHDATVQPDLYVESNGTVIRAPTGMRHKVTLLDGGNYFLLYSNPGGAVQAGTPVSVVIGDVRLAPMVAQS